MSARSSWIQDVEKYVENLDRVIRTLSNLRDDALASKITIVRTISSQRAINWIPEELLLHVFKFVIESRDEWIDNSNGLHYTKQLRRIGGVCSRFRQIVISTPSLWTALSNKMCREEVNVFLERSKDLLLTITVHQNEVVSKNSLLFLRNVTRHCRRWRSLSVLSDPGAYRDAVQSACEELKNLILPELIEFKYERPSEYGYVQDFHHDVEWDGEGFSGPNYFHFYTTWDAPKLRKLTGKSIIFKAVTSTSTSSTNCITTCSMRFCDRGWQRPLDPLANLWSFLETQLRLEHLNIQADFPLYCRNSDRTQNVRLPSLKTLTVRARRFLCHRSLSLASVRTVLSIMKTLELPSIRRMTLKCPIPNDRFALEKLFPHFNDYAELDDLSIHFSHFEKSSLTLSPFRTIFQRARNLRKLTIKSEDTIVTGETPECFHAQPPPLLKLDLSFCRKISDDAVISVLQYLGDGRRGEEFQELRLDSSRKTAEFLPAVLSMMPSSKISFITRTI